MFPEDLGVSDIELDECRNAPENKKQSMASALSENKVHADFFNDFDDLFDDDDDD